jgi:hypothetical protein
MAAAPAFDEMDAEAAEEDDAPPPRRGGRSAEAEPGWGALSDDEIPSSAAGAVAARPAAPVITAGSGPEWGTLAFVGLTIAALLGLLGIFVGMDLVTNLNEFRADGPATGLVKAIAGLFGGS